MCDDVLILCTDLAPPGGTFALFSLLRRAINLQFDVSGPDLPSDYRLTHYATVPEGGQAQDKADDLPPPHKAYEPPLATGSQAQGNGGAGGCAGKSTVNGRRSTGGPGGDVEAGRPGGQRDWRRELGKSFFLRKIISVMVVTGAWCVSSTFSALLNSTSTLDTTLRGWLYFGGWDHHTSHLWCAEIISTACLCVDH